MKNKRYQIIYKMIIINRIKIKIIKIIIYKIQILDRKKIAKIIKKIFIRHYLLPRIFLIFLNKFNKIYFLKVLRMKQDLNNKKI